MTTSFASLLLLSTQDVHLGDASNISYDGDNIVRHVGAHNMIRTLNWVFSNFPNPTNIFLTGCSAGGTAVPIAYDLINKHYNSFLKGGSRSVNINTISEFYLYSTFAGLLCGAVLTMQLYYLQCSGLFRLFDTTKFSSIWVF